MFTGNAITQRTFNEIWTKWSNFLLGIVFLKNPHQYEINKHQIHMSLQSNRLFKDAFIAGFARIRIGIYRTDTNDMTPQIWLH